MSEDIPVVPDSETTARKAIEVNPHSPLGYYNLGLLLAQDPARFSEAEAAFRTVIELEPNNPRYVYRLGLLLHENLHRPEEAESTYRRAITLAPDDPFFYGGLLSLLIQGSRRAEALVLGEKMRALLNASGNWYGLATLDAILGNLDAAIEQLRKAAGQEDFDCEWARRDPDLASLHADRRFGEIVGSCR